MPTLVLTGTIDVKQFWPMGGESDADTIKVSVTGQAHPWKVDGQPTTVFDNAKIHGQTVKPPVDDKGFVVIRLQGIDAPELHYPPEQYRQPQGESAANALAQHFGTIGQQVVNCRVTTNVKEPNDVFDTYGRMVGDVHVHFGSAEKDVNLWLAQEGWAFPTFYDSMTHDEIKTIIQLTEAARSAKKNIWKHYSVKIGPLDTSLKFQKHGTLGADSGPVVMPKLFRRLCGWNVAKSKGASTGATLRDFIAAEKKPDLFYSTDDFLQNKTSPANRKHLDSVINAHDTLQVMPKDMTFHEAPSTLMDAAGQKITHW